MFDPTDEQAFARDMFLAGESMVVEAGAGTGKTSTLMLLANSTDRFGQYLAFNKAIVEDVQKKLPGTVRANTAHSLAMRAVGFKYRERMSSKRMRSDVLASILKCPRLAVRYEGKTKVLHEQFLAGLVMRAISRFCQTADPEPTWKHVPYIDGIDSVDILGRKSYDNNNKIAAALEPVLKQAWADLIQTEGALQFTHAHYLKIWQLSDPKIDADFIMFDEAQDASPVMADIVAQQEGAQLVYVGDSAQAIYEWTGAVNALAKFETDNRCYLSQSFRFGQAIADHANVILGKLGATLTLKGHPPIESVVDSIDGEPGVILCRTNGMAVMELLNAQDRGLSPHLVGGGTDVLSFARSAQALKTTGHTNHHELACFDSWAEVEDYVQNDARGDELEMLVNLVNRYGIMDIETALGAMPSEKKADIIVSTAHKAKGREWSKVRIAGDFYHLDELEGQPGEQRLLYVASTRAQHHLDATRLKRKLTAG